ncbi:MAG: hypothetical protein GC178_01095 [Flavobacteriales bacterium]|nr:hypothetical protein [Flavobacteriales bacterium]
MRQFILGLGLLAMSSLGAQACDQCGCASSGYMGIVPQFGRHYVGLRYQFQQFETRHTSLLDVSAKTARSREYFHTMELRGSYYPHKRVQLLAAVPLVYRSQISDTEGSSTSYGLGDVWLGANYTVFASPDSLTKKVRHHVFVGTGLKTPTGKTDLKSNGELLHRNLQPGTGSWDVDMSLRYLARIKRWGVSAAANYRLNTTNRDHYKYGDRITSMVGVFYWTVYRNVTFMPQVGVNLDYAFQDIDGKRLQTHSGGYQVSATGGLQVSFKRLIGSVSYSQPMFFNLSQGETTPKHQVNLSILITI